MESKKRVECEPGYHHLFVYNEPFAKETGEVTLIAICSSCGHPVRYEFSLNESIPVQVIESN